MSNPPSAAPHSFMCGCCEVRSEVVVALPDLEDADSTGHERVGAEHVFVVAVLGVGREHQRLGESEHLLALLGCDIERSGDDQHVRGSPVLVEGAVRRRAATPRYVDRSWLSAAHDQLTVLGKRSVWRSTGNSDAQATAIATVAMPPSTIATAGPSS